MCVHTGALGSFLGIDRILLFSNGRQKDVDVSRGKRWGISTWLAWFTWLVDNKTHILGAFEMKIYRLGPKIALQGVNKTSASQNFPYVFCFNIVWEREVDAE